MSNAITAEELRADFLDTLRGLVSYWSSIEDQTTEERMNGLVFSILNIFDGTSGFPCAVDLTLRPHPDDKAYNQENGDDWIEDGTVINDCHLHELWYRPNAEAKP